MKELPPPGHVRIYINSGHLSVDNGCKAPLTQFSLVIEEKDLFTVVDILTENKFLYKVEGVHEQWQNVLTSEVRRRLGVK